MNPSSRLLLPALLLAAPLVHAQPEADDEPAAEERARDTVNIQFQGTLREAIAKIAQEGRLNVLTTGELDMPAQVNLQRISAEQALRTLARAYSLKLEQDGAIYTLRPMTAEEKVAAVAAPPPPVLAPVPPVNAPFLDEDEIDEIKERVRESMKKTHHSSKGSRDVVARGHSIEVKSGETVDSAVVYGGNLTVRGDVEDDAVVYGGNLEITGRVQGDASAFGGNVVLGPEAVVEGDVSAFGGSVLKQDGARVEGEINSLGGAHLGRMVAGEVKKNLKEVRQQDSSEQEEKSERRGGFAFFVLEFALLFGLGFLGQLLFPERMKELGEEIRRHPARSGVLGLLGVMALIPTLLVLMVTIIGIPVAAALLLVLPVLTVLGFAAVASELGRTLPFLGRHKTQATVLAAGLFVLLALGSLPWVGPLILVLAALVSLGAITRTRFGHRPQGIPEPLSHDRIPL